MGSEVEIRPAEPGDAAIAAQLIYATGPEYSDFAFSINGEDPREFFREMFRMDDGVISHRLTQVAVMEGEVVGIDLSHPGADTKRLKRELAKHVVWFYGVLAVPAAVRRSNVLDMFLIPPPDDSMYIAHLAVLSTCRSAGIGQMLLENRRRIARELDLPRLSLNVAMTNSRAESFYRRNGFSLVEEFTDEALERKHGIPGSRLLVADVG